MKTRQLFRSVLSKLHPQGRRAVRGELILAGVLALGLLLALAVELSQAQNVNEADDSINVQGRLVSGGSPVNGGVNVTFRLYDTDAGGTALWSETKSVTANDGYFLILTDSVVCKATSSL
jgi:hypothetical protein